MFGTAVLSYLAPRNQGFVTWKLVYPTSGTGMTNTQVTYCVICGSYIRLHASLRDSQVVILQHSYFHRTIIEVMPNPSKLLLCYEATG
jgi:hypothetical protein